MIKNRAKKHCNGFKLAKNSEFHVIWPNLLRSNNLADTATMPFKDVEGHSLVRCRDHRHLVAQLQRTSDEGRKAGKSELFSVLDFFALGSLGLGNGAEPLAKKFQTPVDNII